MEKKKSYVMVVDSNEFMGNSNDKNQKKKHKKKYFNKNYKHKSNKDIKKVEKPVNKRKISYLVEVNGKCVKSGTAMIDFSKMREFEQEIANTYRKKPTDIIEVFYR